MTSLKTAYLPLLAAAAIFGVVIAATPRNAPQERAEARGVTSARPERPAAQPASRAPAFPSFADIADAALRSVVTITSTEIVRGNVERSPFGGEDPFEFFFGPRRGTPRDRRQVAGGSGFVITDDGEIVTNNHVVAGAEKIQVKLRDRRVFTARVLGTDPVTDVALIKVESRARLIPLQLGDSDRLRVGDWVMAVGNPLYFEGTVTVGVVSGEGRRGLSDDPNAAAFENLIQTDAAINFGNSGGPLIDTAGNVVGINTAMIQPAQNIGFAVAINTARSILPQLKTKGRVVRGMLGVQVTQIDQDIQKAFGLPSMEGAFVEAVEPGKPAAKAGMQHGDTITRVDDKPVREPKDLIDHVSALPPGRSVRLTVLRGGKSVQLTATLAERRGEEASPARTSAEPGSGAKLGVTVVDVTPEIRRQLNLPGSVEGVVVTDVADLSPAAEKGIAPGDLITEVNGVPVKSVEQLRREVAKTRSGQYIRLYVRRFGPEELSRYVVIQAE